MTNSLGGNGVARIPEMFAKGMNVTLGHDCFFTLDTAEYIRYSYLLHKAHNANPLVIPPFQVMDMALGNGAKALGWDESIGSLEEEKAADIIIIDPDSPSPVTPASVFSYFTMTSSGSGTGVFQRITTVVTHGKTLHPANVTKSDKARTARFMVHLLFVEVCLMPTDRPGNAHFRKKVAPG